MAPCNCNLLLGASTIFFLLLAIPIPTAAPLSFNFTSFDPVNTRDQITFEGDASVANSSILLTKNLLHLPQDQRNQSIGRAAFSRPIHLHDAASGALADFATFFSFVINSIDNTTFADGIAFFFAPVDIPFPSVRFGGGLGLVDGVGTSNQFVAVEFDTFSNEWDPVGGSHAGIDVNTMISVINTTWFSSIRDGKTNDASVNYDSRSKNLTVSFTGFRNGTRILQSLSYSIDLRNVLPEYVKFGFSGATGESFELHTIQSWSFNSSDLKIVEKRSQSTRTKLVVGLVGGVSAVLMMAVLYLVYLLFWKKEKSRDDDDDHNSHYFIDEDELDSNAGPRRFSYRELARATGNFSDASKLGTGGFGSVYKGMLNLKGSDEPVAVKRVSRDSKQGIREYAAEIRSISRLRHRNVVQLMGWCHQKRNSLLLVYEFMPNGSLDSHLFGGETKSGVVLLTWASRYRIALNLASALLYLQEEWNQCVVHRDIKSSNVMLDSDFNAKLGDFGLARLVDHAKGARTTAVAGTMGYMAPECITAGRATKESDVYSFGIVLLEIACGRRPVTSEAAAAEGEVLMVEWAWNLYGGGRLLEAADRRLRGDFVEREMRCLMVVGLWCAHPDHALRPSIREAIAALKFETELPDLPPKMPMPVYVVPVGSMVSASSSSGALVGSSVWTNDDTSQPFTPPLA